MVNEVPKNDISALAVDTFQPNTWYATTPVNLCRSIDNGESWEIMNRFPDDEETVLVRVNNLKPGEIAVITNRTSDPGSMLYVSDDRGETWRKLAETVFFINDLAWTSRGGLPLLIMATDKGLFELQLDASPIQIAVDSSRPSMGFYAIAASKDNRDRFFVAAAAREKNGVFISDQGGESNTFTLIGGKEDDIRLLEVQHDGVRTFLWAGSFVAGNELPKGCLRWELQGAEPPTTVTRIVKNWDGGSCRRLAFSGSFAFAATHHKGVAWLDLSGGDQAAWRAPLMESGLPLRGDESRAFQPLKALAAAAQPISALNTEPRQNIVMAGGSMGIYRSTDDGTTYQEIPINELHMKKAAT